MKKKMLAVWLAVVAVAVTVLIVSQPRLAFTCGDCPGCMHDEGSDGWCVSVCDRHGCICESGSGCYSVPARALPVTPVVLKPFKGNETAAQRSLRARLQRFKNMQELVDWANNTPGVTYDGPGAKSR